jgi:hypothetical protein
LDWPGIAGILPAMQTFGRRQYAHMELDPWASKKKSREDNPRDRSVPTSRIAGYLIALVAVGVIAVASFEMLVLA